MQLKVGEEKEYKLKAPEGTHDIIVTDGKSEAKASGIPFAGSSAITGGAIDIKEKGWFGDFFIYKKLKLLGSLLLVLILGFLGIMIFKKQTVQRSYGNIGKGEENSTSPMIMNVKKEQKLTKDDGFVEMSGIGIAPRVAEQVVDIKGAPQETTIVCLKIKNYEEIKNAHAETTTETLQNIIKSGWSKRAVLYKSQGYFILLFIPSIARTFQNQRTAIELASELQELLKKHNQLFKQRLQYGIAVSSGTIIVKQEKDKIQFGTTTNILGSVKKLAESAQGDVLMSEDIRKKLAASKEVKVEKLQEQEAYKLKSSRAKQEEHEKFIQRFMERNPQNKKDQQKPASDALSRYNRY